MHGIVGLRIRQWGDLCRRVDAGWIIVAEIHRHRELPGQMNAGIRRCKSLHSRANAKWKGGWRTEISRPRFRLAAGVSC